MAKPTLAATAAAKRTAEELKKELKRLVKAIADDDDAKTETFDEASRILLALKDLKLSSSSSSSNCRNENKKKKNSNGVVVEIPEQFLCPISSEIMKDPVILQSGQTYDRPFIQEWLNSGNRTCPKTQLVLTNPTLTPNHLVRTLISHWCTEHGFALPPPTTINPDNPPITATERNSITSLLNTLSPSSIPSTKQAVKDLRLLTKQKTSIRAFIGQNPEFIPQILSLLSYPTLNSDRELHEDIVTTILNLSIFESNKKILGDDLRTIPILVDALTSGTMQTRSNAAAALFSLSALDSNKVKIGELGAMKGLVELLQSGTLEARKDAANATFTLCTNIENRSLAVKEGVASVLLLMIMDNILVGEALAILAMVSGHRAAAEEVVELDGVAYLFKILSDSACARNKENAVVILYSVCVDHRMKLREVGEEEAEYGTVSHLVSVGTSRARRKATGILERLRRTMHNAHHSC